jgi:hypothetical protein
MTTYGQQLDYSALVNKVEHLVKQQASLASFEPGPSTVAFPLAYLIIVAPLAVILTLYRRVGKGSRLFPIIALVTSNVSLESHPKTLKLSPK